MMEDEEENKHYIVPKIPKDKFSGARRDGIYFDNLVRKKGPKLCRQCLNGNCAFGFCRIRNCVQEIILALLQVKKITCVLESKMSWGQPGSLSPGCQQCLTLHPGLDVAIASCIPANVVRGLWQGMPGKRKLHFLRLFCVFSQGKFAGVFCRGVFFLR